MLYNMCSNHIGHNIYKFCQGLFKVGGLTETLAENIAGGRINNIRLAFITFAKEIIFLVVYIYLFAK